MPAIDPTMLKSVFYIYPNIEDAKNSEDFGETAFFVWIQSEAVPEVGYLYAVSCWLVVHDTSPKPVIRVNTEDGKFDTIKAIYDDWIRHPHNDDVAIMSIGLDAKYSYGQFFRNRMLNDDIAKEKAIGVVDEVIMIGKFRARAGKSKNIPVALFGYISMMPDEPIYNPKIKRSLRTCLRKLRAL